jgi:hypothetical protein
MKPAAPVTRIGGIQVFPRGRRILPPFLADLPMISAIYSGRRQDLIAGRQ